jgi:hypothetical protein
MSCSSNIFSKTAWDQSHSLHLKIRIYIVFYEVIQLYGMEQFRKNPFRDISEANSLLYIL